MKALVLIAVLLGPLGINHGAHAQVVPCGSPGAGNVVVGEQPGGNGVAPIALCEVAPEQGYAASRPMGPVNPSPLPGLYGAFVVDDAKGTYLSVYGQQNEDMATHYAQMTCMAQGGKSCRVLFAFQGYAAVVSDSEGRYYEGKHDLSGVEAMRKAFANCNQKSAIGGCTILTPPIMYGAVQSTDTLTAVDVLPLPYGKNWAKKDQSAWQEGSRLGADLNALSARMDTRDYWGAVASDGGEIQTSYNRPDQQAAEVTAQKECNGCKVVQVFKNSCAGIAWPKDNKPVLETALDASPEPAKDKAMALCAGKYGECVAKVRCSGRAYAQSNPDAPQDTNKALP